MNSIVRSPSLAGAHARLDEPDILQALVAHQCALPPDKLIEDAQALLHRAQVDFAAVVEGGRVLGLLGRNELDQRLGSRSGIGFALYARRPVRELMHSPSLRVTLGQPVTEVLATVIGRSGHAFHDDVLLVEPDGAFVGFIAVQTLVQLQHQLLEYKLERLAATTESLENARDAALGAARAKSEFLANMSHEIRTPMNGVLGMTSLLLHSHLNDEQHECAVTIQRSGESLLTVLNDILDFSKIESGHLDLEIQPVVLESCIVNVLHLFAGKAAEKDLELLYRIDRDAPAEIPSDPNRLQQILSNLIGNAVKFTERGEVLVHVRCCPLGSGSLRFEVSDSGIGIPLDKQSALFQPFNQVDSSTARRFGGTGLGLAICRRLVELLGGSVGLQSQPGHGATFWFTLPAPPASVVYPPCPVIPLSAHRRQLLIVDDNATCRTILREIVDPACFVVTELSSASEFLALGPALRSFDFILVDAHLTADFAAFVRELQRIAADVLPRIAFMDRFGSQTLRDHAALIGGRFALHKPISPVALLGWLERRPEHTAPIIPIGGKSVERLEQLAELHILVAEDNIVNQRVILQMLRKLGCTVDAVMNGAQAFAAIDRASYDVVLMDMQMPEMDGYEATRLVRARIPVERQPRIIALTAHALVGDREKCLAAGVDDYLTKPVAFTTLIPALQRAIAPRVASSDNSLPFPFVA